MKIKNPPSCHVHQGSLDTASLPKNFLKKELELETGCLVTTDHGVLSACRTVYDLAKANNLTPILGIESYIRDDECPILKQFGISKDKDDTYSNYNKYYHLTMHCLNQKAYEKLSTVLSDAWLNRTEKHGSEQKPLFSWKEIEELGSYDITMGSSCLIGIVARHLMNDREDIAEAHYQKIRSLAKSENFYVELFPNICDKKWEDGVFIELENGEKLKFYEGKTLKTEDGEIKAIDLVKAFNKGNGHSFLKGIKNRKLWENKEGKIVSAVKVSDFMNNECSPNFPNGDIQLYANKFIFNLAKKYKDPIIFSDDSHFSYPDEKIVQDIKLTNGITGHSWKFAGSYHRKSGQEAKEYFVDYMGLSQRDFEELIQNSIDWSSRFKDFKFDYKPSIPASFYPKDVMAYAAKIIEDNGRMDWNNPKMVERLKYEINLFTSNGKIDLLPYFFPCQEVLKLYEDNEELTAPGRGSAGGVLLCYLFGITHVNPLKHNLSIDRFLSKDRIEDGRLPDIDMDFPNRDLLVGPKKEYLKERFGEYFAQISTDTQMRIRSSIKDVNRALHNGEVDSYIEKITGKIPYPPQGISDYNYLFGYKDSDGKEIKGIIDTCAPLQEYIKKYPEEFEIVEKCLQICRSKGRHASAFLVADKPVKEFIPLMKVGDVTVTQYAMGDCESNGGIKLDFLCVNSLSDVGDCLKLIRKKNGISKEFFTNGKKIPLVRLIPFKDKFYDIWDLPEDMNVYRTICDGDTETVFQLDTPSAKRWLKEFDFEVDGKPSIKSIEGIAAFNALNRPGPLDYFAKNEKTGKMYNMLQEFAFRLRNSDYKSEISLLDDLIPETKGVLIYQEQLMNIYKVLTDCDAKEVNDFRVNIGKKKMEKVLKMKPKFVERASEKIGIKQANKVWDMLETFGQYGFCSAHSHTYSYVSYACAFLKYHYPLEWWCSVLKNAKKDEVLDKFWPYCNELVAFPDINLSKDVFDIVGDKIQAPIDLLMGIGPQAHKEICENRPYKDIEDFCAKIIAKKEVARSALNSGVVDKLIISGVADSLFKDKDMTISDKFALFNKTMASLTGKKNIEQVESDILNISKTKLYQYRKSILPIYSEDLTKYISENNHSINNLLNELDLPLLNSNQFKQLMNEELGPTKRISVAIIAYVIEHRNFKFANKTMDAISLKLDIGGNIYEFAKWPRKDNRMSGVPKSDLTGSVIMAVLNRWNIDRPFVLEKVFVIEKALEKE
ncbi:MAG: DNA polymerase III subunit alpha [Elusimicrobia bacterium]|nr:DNA polymerase III subunit alpha [Elusimicrobiota bacterium]